MGQVVMNGRQGPTGRKPIEVVPAIDLRGGLCVRLYQGDFGRETVFSEEPAKVAVHWENLGAKRLHVVDLDGAASGEVRHWAIIEDIVRRVGIPVQVGGGIRDVQTIERLIAIGVKRVILGTIAVEDPGLVRDACRLYREAVTVSVDARDGFASTRGWKNPTKMGAVELAQMVVKAGAGRIIYTDIASDGTLGEPNFKGIGEIMSRIAVPLVAAGGISSVEHVVRLRDMGVEGAIVGRALYTGGVNLSEALEAANAGSGEPAC